ncbi:hypothetical protein RB195_011838 [Necator americanus]|uniref:Uncharacterized protein n=1 Tax=Necator americanus TaxID=51031 RepID=A0ABR1D486_NECAM
MPKEAETSAGAARGSAAAAAVHVSHPLSGTSAAVRIPMRFSIFSHFVSLKRFSAAVLLLLLLLLFSSSSFWPDSDPPPDSITGHRPRRSRRRRRRSEHIGWVIVAGRNDETSSLGVSFLCGAVRRRWCDTDTRRRRQR